ncbi:MAG: PadR family transcriptional regulator [Acidobacteriia bacterium]|nr:PadR family transcriptional regulator [Terriglobia bacterium]
MSKQGPAGPRGSLFQGTLDLLVLRILTSGPQHGYAISRRLGELSGEWLQIDEGSLYPCLYRMEERGWVRSETALSENKRKARYYSLTGTGKRHLQLELDNWLQFRNVVENVIEKA